MIKQFICILDVRCPLRHQDMDEMVYILIVEGEPTLPGSLHGFHEWEQKVRDAIVSGRSAAQPQQ